MPPLTLSALLWCGLACDGDGLGRLDDPEPPAGFDWGAARVCDDPVSGIDRFTEEGAARGLTAVLPSTEEVYGTVLTGRGGSLAVEDLDADGDVDVLAGGFDGTIDVYENDGSGMFTHSELSFRLFGSDSLEAIAVGDLDGDGLPEVILPANRRFITFENRGSLIFDEGRSVSVAPEDARRTFLTGTLGDVDGDGDLDLSLPSIGTPSESLDEDAGEGDPDPLVLWESGAWTLYDELDGTGEGSRCRAATFTDRDRDGDADLFVVSDSGPPSSFWRNDGPDGGGALVLEDDASAIQADLVMAAMGLDGWDFNQDGLLDYCISDLGPPRCLQSEPDGGYTQIQSTLSLTPDAPVTARFPTVGWSLDLTDLDNDGHVDMVQASGPEHASYAAGVSDFPDLMWQGRGDGTFEDVTAEAGFGDVGSHAGLATADVDGDGWQDVLVVGPGESPLLWMNRCGEDHWLQLELVAAGPNTTAIGAVVEAEVGDTIQLREVLSLRGPGQRPTRLHFGLGDADTVERLTIWWPDGSVTEATDVPVDRVVTATQ